MRNLYIVNTPLHLFTAYILANHYTAEQENVLALVNPKGFVSWKNSRCLTKMYTDETTWAKTIVGTKDYLRESLKSKGILGTLSKFKEEINSGGRIDQVYLASDKIIGNQLLVEMSGNTNYIRFDEGTSSYVQLPERQVKSKIAEYLTVQAVRLLAGLHSKMIYNYNGIGRAQAATADYLFKPQMLERPSPKAVAIEEAAILHALDKVAPAIEDYKELSTGNIIMFLGSQLTDRGKLDRGTELDILRRLTTMADTIHHKIVYKPHPGELREKLDYYREQMPDMRFFDSVEPMEIILYRYSNIKALVTGVHTSAMLYADLFAKEQIRSISATWLMGWGPGPIGHLLEKAGMKTPENIEELQQLISTLKQAEQV